MRTPKMKRNFWKKEEVKCMLAVFKDLNICQLLEQKTLPNNDIYKLVEHEMSKRGFKTKTGKQIQSKWSQMKSAYICIKRNHKADFYAMKDPEFRDEVAELVEADTEMRVAVPPVPSTTCSSPRSMNEYAVDLENVVTMEEDPVEIEDEELECTPDHHESPNDVIEWPEEVQPRKGKETARRQGSYRKSFSRFIQQLKAVENDLQNEFIRKQSRLLEQERKLQMQRDNQIISSFAENTNQILKSTQELILKGFGR